MSARRREGQAEAFCAQCVCVAAMCGGTPRGCYEAERADDLHAGSEAHEREQTRGGGGACGTRRS
jgi:hypothetical protein